METPAKSTTSRDAASRDQSRKPCGCGLSSAFPFCDGSQMIPKTHLARSLVSCGAARPVDPAGVEPGAS